MEPIDDVDWRIPMISKKRSCLRIKRSTNSHEMIPVHRSMHRKQHSIPHDNPLVIEVYITNDLHLKTRRSNGESSNSGKKTLIVLNIMSSFGWFGRIGSKDMIIHQCWTTKKTETTWTTHLREKTIILHPYRRNALSTYHTTENVFRSLLQPMANSIFEFLIPNNRTWNVRDEQSNQTSNVCLTAANWMDTSTSSTDFLILLHSINE